MEGVELLEIKYAAGRDLLKRTFALAQELRVCMRKNESIDA